MFKKQLSRFVQRIKELHGDPHYVALGMALGAFVGITPTIPFHTVLVLILAFVFRASKAAAVIGVWISNPVTVFFIYAACHKTGYFLLGGNSGGFESIKILIQHLEGNAAIIEKLEYFRVFLNTQLRIFLVMNLGGVILGIPTGIAAYVTTRAVMVRRMRKKQGKTK